MRRSTMVVATFLLPVWLCFAAGCGPPEWDQMSYQGIEAAKSGRHDEAERLIESALAVGPGDGMELRQEAELLGWLSWLQSRHPDPTQAIATLEGGIPKLQLAYGTTIPTRRALRRLAQMESRRDNLERSEVLFREYLGLVETLSPINSLERVGAMSDMAHILRRLDKFDEAQQQIDKALGILDRFELKSPVDRGTLLLLAAAIRVDRNQHTAARPLFEEALSNLSRINSPPNLVAEAASGLARVHVAAGHREEAEAAYRTALEALEDPEPAWRAFKLELEAEYEAFRNS